MLLTRLRLAGAYENQEKFDDALEIANEALSKARKIGDIDNELRALNYLAIINQKLKKFDESETYFLEMLQVGDIFSSLGTGYAVGNIRNLYIEMGEYEKYLNLMKQLLNKAQKVKNDSWINDFSLRYSISCFNLGKYQYGLEFRQSAWPYINVNYG